MKKALIRHITAFLLSVVFALGFLLLGACLPQEPIDEHFLPAVEQLMQGGDAPRMGDHAFASMLDYATDSIILAESRAASSDHWDYILTNPLFAYEGSDSEDIPMYSLYQYALDEDPQPSSYYVQYWMGFRPIIRLMLTFLDYHQILRYVALGIFVLFAAVMCSVARETDTKTAFFFALSIIFVRLYVVAVSLQFSCCFFIAFIAMLLVPWIHRHPKWESVFFLEIGIATMYFDFYTTPILTFGMPMIYLYLLKLRDCQTGTTRRLGLDALSWSAGYFFMWIAKLVLTSALTHADGIGYGFSAFAERTGITKYAPLEDYYDPILSLRSVAASLYSDQEGKYIFLAALLLAAIGVLILFFRRKRSLKALVNHRELLILAALPLIWFMAAAQPTANHHWFQYRGIAVSFWAVLMYLQLLLKKEKPTS